MLGLKVNPLFLILRTKLLLNLKNNSLYFQVKLMIFIIENLNIKDKAINYFRRLY